MVNAKKEGLIEATDAKLVEKIFKRYLVDEYQEDETGEQILFHLFAYSGAYPFSFPELQSAAMS